MEEILVILNSKYAVFVGRTKLGGHTMRHNEYATNGCQRHPDKRNELLIKRMSISY